MTESLFPELIPTETAPAEVGESTPHKAARRLRERRDALMAAGYHPLANLVPRLRLHPQAAPPTDRAAAGLRCGDCAQLFRRSMGGSWLKCELHPSRGGSSDMRAWWPACQEYIPKDAP